MVRYAKLEYDIEVPEDITVEVTNNSSIEIKGPLGKIARDFEHTRICLLYTSPSPRDRG